MNDLLVLRVTRNEKAMLLTCVDKEIVHVEEESYMGTDDEQAESQVRATALRALSERIDLLR